MTTPAARGNLLLQYRRKLAPLVTDDHPTIDSLLNRLLDADPQGGKNARWILDAYIRREFLLEDIPRVHDDIQEYLQVAKGLSVKERPLAKHTYREVKDILARMQPEIEEQEGDIDGARVLYDGPLGRLTAPLTQEASCKLGAGTKWCTAAKKNNMFGHYIKGCQLYIWRDKQERKKYQFCFGENQDPPYGNMQFMDAQDNRLPVEKLEYFRTEHPVLSKLFNRMLSNSFAKVGYVKTIGMTPKGFEEQMLASPAALNYATSVLEAPIANPEHALNFARSIGFAAYQYARDVLKRRWPEAEPIILTNPRASLFYAQDILGSRWYAAEPIILTDPIVAGEYAQYVLKRRWLEAEPIILTNTWASLFYAQDVLKRRWLEAEPIIKTDPEAAYIYANDVIKGPWPDAEPIILTNAEAAMLYAKHVLKRRWPEAEPIIETDPAIWRRYKEHFGI